jgi:predicted AAA+ superfamily ATPase
MFQRKLLYSLNKWKNKNHRKPLILRGARQVGKTTLVKMFSKEFDDFIYLNLDIKHDRELFVQVPDAKSFLNLLLLRENKRLEKTQSLLIFIDEIQSSSVAVNMLRYFYEDIPEIHIIAAGSLLETLLHDNLGFPVGRVEYLILRPFSFEENLMAIGHTQVLAAIDEVPLPKYLHETLLSLFKKYCLIGGMPEIVRNYIETDDLVAVGETFQSLITAYLEDVEKYSKKDNEIRIIRHCIDTSLRIAGERIKFEGFGGGKYKSKEIGEALRMLEKTMLITLVYPSEATRLPLLENKKKSPRLQLLDTGMLNYFAGVQLQILQNPNIDDVFEGKIAEHIVGQELLTLNPLPLHKNHFWVRDKKQSDAEVDYLVSYNDLLIPVEIKAGKTGKLRSLMEFVDASPHPFAVRIYSGELSIDKIKTIKGKEFQLLNLPFYLVCRINEYIKWLFDTSKL